MPPANTLVRWVNENAFAFIVQARPCPTFGRPVHLWGGPHRLRPGTSPHALRIPSRDGHSALPRIASPASEGFSPAFGYDAPHSSARGTSTLPNNALLSAPCEPLRHPSRPGRALASCQLIPTAITPGASRVAPDPLCLHAVANTPAGPRELRSLITLPSTSAFPRLWMGRHLHYQFRGLLSVHSRYNLQTRRVALCDPLPRRLRRLCCLRRRSDCYRVERSSSRAGLSPAVDQCLFTAHHNHSVMSVSNCVEAGRPRSTQQNGFPRDC